MRFEFATANRILFGPGVLAEVGERARVMGGHALVVTGSNPDRAAPLIDTLHKSDVQTSIFAVHKEPTVEMAGRGVQQAKRLGCDLVVSMGGGSVIDAGKAIAALATNQGAPLDYLEVIGKGQPLVEPPLPFIAIPTTAGTGAEVTRNAVLASKEHQRKVSLRSPLMLPDLAVLDPELTYSVPPDVTARTGMDALTQCVEPYVSHLANPLTDGLALEGIGRAGRALRRVYQNGNDAEARADMMIASLIGGLALANAKLGAVHGFAGPMGGMFDIPHGTICAALLPHVMRVNLDALRRRDPGNPALVRYKTVGRVLVGEPDAGATQAIEWVEATCKQLKIPRLSEFGVTTADLPEIAAKSTSSSSMKGNPIPLTQDEMVIALRSAL